MAKVKSKTMQYHEALMDIVHTDGTFKDMIIRYNDFRKTQTILKRQPDDEALFFEIVNMRFEEYRERVKEYDTWKDFQEAFETQVRRDATVWNSVYYDSMYRHLDVQIGFLMEYRVTGIAQRFTRALQGAYYKVHADELIEKHMAQLQAEAKRYGITL